MLKIWTGDHVGLVKESIHHPCISTGLIQASFNVSCSSEKFTTNVFGDVNRANEVQKMIMIDQNLWVARKNGNLEELLDGSVSRTIKVSNENSINVGLGAWNDKLYTCTRSGEFKMYCRDDNEQLMNLSIGQDVYISRVTKGIMACGGKERDLCLFDLNAEQPKPLWKAKNVKNDMLDLRNPIWITDLQFIGDSTQEIVTSTAYKQLRIYDTRVARRPVNSKVIAKAPIKRIELVNGSKNLLFSDNECNFNHFDLRQMKVVGGFKNNAGTVTDFEICNNYVVSVSLDRFFRIHDLRTHELLGKGYLKQKLKSVVASFEEGCPESEEDEEKVWESMEIIEEGRSEKKRTSPPTIVEKSKKSKVE